MLHVIMIQRIKHRCIKQSIQNIPSRIYTRYSSCTTSVFNATNTNRTCFIHRLGMVPYETAWEWQKQLIQDRIKLAREGKSSLNDIVLLLQHPSIYTLGRGASMENVKFNPKEIDQGILKLLRVDRGGEVTYHGPGQLVVYPILDLNHYKKDLHWYLRQIEQVVIQLLAKLDIQGERCDGLTGVWVKDPKNPSSIHDMKKIAAVGTHASRWITMHGFAINVTTDLSAFDRIIPCGIQDRGVTSIMEHYKSIAKYQVESNIGNSIVKNTISIDEVENATIAALIQVFGMEVIDMRTSNPI